MSEYDALLDVIAAHPGASRGELRELAGDAEREIDPEAVDDLLNTALASEDALEANGSHWVMRTGRFYPTEYDHPITNEWRDDEL